MYCEVTKKNGSTSRAVVNYCSRWGFRHVFICIRVVALVQAVRLYRGVFGILHHGDRRCVCTAYLPNRDRTWLTCQHSKGADVSELSPDEILRFNTNFQQGQWELLAFTSASIALKLILLELAKYLMISSRRPVSRRVMVTLVATPTILVDTQIRMVLLRQSSTNVSVVGTVLLAGLEIAVRAVKSLVVQRQTRGIPIPKNMSRRWFTFAVTCSWEWVYHVFDCQYWRWGSPTFATPTPILTVANQIKPVQVMPASRTTSSKLGRFRGLHT
ncbi:unnamed protein product [Phytophthora lilii]|uniref:Unnamed protein product n=1 Tax=Phytophthora lilii TaxID=2077276 RepID=A0A9W6TK08_9STRA|nr:unnamed protein product [Phytophthora lilii]